MSRDVLWVKYRCIQVVTVRWKGGDGRQPPRLLVTPAMARVIEREGQA